MSYFLCKNFLGDDDFLNKIVYQPAFNMLELKEDKDTECVFSWKSKRVYSFKFTPWNTAFLHNIKRFRYKTGSEFNKVVSVVEQNNYLTKFVNIYIAYDLDNWLRNMLNNLH